MSQPSKTTGGTGFNTANVIPGSAEGGSSHPCDKRVSVRYQKTQIGTAMKGGYFEIKLIALLFLRLKNSEVISEFHLASSVKGAGAIDDIVVKYRTKTNPHKWTTCFIQLKHKEKCELNDNYFTSSNDFKLSKYLQSYTEIKLKMASSKEFLFEGPINECVFVIYTNAKLRDNLLERKSKSTCCEIEIDTFLKSGSDKQVIFNISEDCDSVLVGFLTSENKNISDVPGFLKALRLFSGQASEEQLDDIIKPELLRVVGNHQTDVNLLFPHFLEAVETWWDKGDKTLTHKGSLVTDSFKSFDISMKSLERRKQFQVDVSFLEEHCFSDCLSNNSFVHIAARKLCTKLSCTKLVQSLGNDFKYMFWSLDDLLNDTEAKISAWSSRRDSRLVIVSESKTKHENICRKLQQVIAKSLGQLKIIVVSTRDDLFTLYLKTCLGVSWTEETDTFKLTQLAPESKERIINKAVIFQGERITLGAFLEGGGDLVPGVLNDNFVQDILKYEDLLIGPPLDTTVPYYIPRTVVKRDVLSLDVLNENTGTFIVHGITADELKRLVPGGEKVGVVGQDDVKKCRFLVVGSGSDRDTSHVRHENVHELKMITGESLRWIRSTSNIDLIKKNVVETQPTESRPNTVMDFEGRITLVEASPGMGKSTICSHLASETKRAHPLTWVVRINLIRHMKLLNSKKWKDGTQFLELCLGINKQSQTERALFRHSMEKQGNVVALIDGCDEVAPEYTEKCLTLLESLRDTQVARVIVTTRHSMRQQIETRLSTLAFSLVPFTKDDQKQFFLEFCNKSGENVVGPGFDRDKLVNKFLSSLERSLTVSDRGFLGIPLHAMMLAEIYVDKFQDSMEDIPEMLDVLYIFKAVIDKKFRIHYEKKFPNTQNVGNEMKIFKKEFNNDHMFAAVVLLVDTAHIQSFNDHTATIINEKNNEFSKSVQDGSNNTGIVVSFLDNMAIFLHRTFAEFFAALWLSKNYSKCRDFLDECLFTEKFKVVRRFFDLLLAEDSNILRSVTNNDVPGVKRLLVGGSDAVDRGERSVLHLAASFGFDCQITLPVPKRVEQEHLVELLLQQGVDVNARDKVFGWTAMEYAIKLRSWDVVDMLVGHSSDENSLSLLEEIMKRKGIEIRCEWHGRNKLRSWSITRYTTSLLHQAAAHGHINIVKLFKRRKGNLIRQFFFPKLFNSKFFNNFGDITDKLTLLHVACQCNQTKIAEYVIDNFKGKHELFARNINRKDSNGSSALHSTIIWGYNELTKLLISKGADIWARDKRGWTLLIAACDSNNVVAARVLIASLGSDSAAAADYVNTRDSVGSSTLHHAISRGYNELTELLISEGADIWARDKRGRTPLMAAFERNNVAAARALIASLGSDSAAATDYVNTSRRDDLKKGSSALQYANRLKDKTLAVFLVSFSGA